MEFIPLIVIFLVMYFFLLRPQQKRLRAQQDLIKSVDVGDDIVTTGGMHGMVTEVLEDALFVEVADGLELKFAREAVSSRIPDPSQTESDADKQESMVDEVEDSVDIDD